MRVARSRPVLGHSSIQWGIDTWNMDKDDIILVLPPLVSMAYVILPRNWRWCRNVSTASVRE